MAFPNFFKDYFYGRSGKRDFTESDLPENRIQLFRDVLSVRRGSMVGLNFLYLLIWIPAVLWTLLNLIQIFSPAEGAAGNYLLQLGFTYLVGLCPMIAVTGPFNMGASYVLRNWARDEHSFVLSDFAAALKENWKQGLIFGIISGLVPLLTAVCIWFYLNMAETSMLFLLPLAVTLLAALIWSLSAMILPTMIVTYRQGFFAQLRNAVLMILAALPRAILIRLATLALPLLLAVFIMLSLPFSGIFAALVLVLYAIFMPAFNKLIHASFANALCEKYLNPRIEGAATNIGLRPKKKIED